MYALALWTAIVIQRLQISSSCGGALNGSGYIQYPNFPAKYGNNSNCLWTLTTSPSHDTILLQLFAFETESCCDSISIAARNGSILHRFIGKNATSVIVKEQSLTIIFISNSSVVKTGFSIHFTSTVSADFSTFRPNVTKSCDIVSVRLESKRGTLWNMNPTSVVFSVMAAESGWSATRHIDYSSSGIHTFNFVGNQRTVYSVSARPETCTLLDSCSTDHGKFGSRGPICLYGSGTYPVTVITSAVQYQLIKDRNSISVNVSPDECRRHHALMKSNSKFMQITCKRKNDNKNYTTRNWPRKLDPCFNYSCALMITYDDASREVARTSFDIATADFSRYHLSVNTKSKYLSANLDIWRSPHWDVEPSFVVFSVAIFGSGVVATRRIAYDLANDTVTFLVNPNTTYTVWAAPETCWPRFNCSGRLTDLCYKSKNCFTGGKTAIKTVTTIAQEATADFSHYRLRVNSTGKYLSATLTQWSEDHWDVKPSFVVISVAVFESGEVTTRRIAYESANETVTFLVNQNTTYTVWAAPETCWALNTSSGRFTEKLYKSTNCFTGGATAIITVTTIAQEDEEPPQSYFVIIGTAIAGGSTCFLLLMALITTYVIMKRRINALSLTITSTGKLNRPTISLEMAARQDEEADDEHYVDMSSAFSNPHDEQGFHYETATGMLRPRVNFYST